MKKIINKTITIVIEGTILVFILVYLTTLSLPKATETAKHEAITVTTKILKAVDTNIHRILNILEDNK